MPSTYTLTKVSSAALLCIGAALLQGCSQKIDARQAQSKQGLTYKTNADDPFTGTLVNFQPNDLGVPVHGACEVHLKDGLLNGTASCVYDNGAKFLEIEYTNGKYNGEFKLWHSQTTKMMAKTDWKNGVKDGIEEHYNPNSGKLVSQVHWTANKKNGQERIWDSDGQVLLTDLSWTDGGGETGYSKSAEHENHFKNGQYEGVQRQYMWRGAYDIYSLADATARQFGGAFFVPLLSKNPQDYKVIERTYKDGQEVKTSAEISAAPQAANSAVDVCLDAKIAAFHKENGADAPIIDDVIQEWKVDCKK